MGTISTEAGLGNLANPPAGIDLAEVRLDLLLSKGVEPEKILTAMAKKEVPILLTLRTREEGGSFNWRSRLRCGAFFLGALWGEHSLVGVFSDCGRASTSSVGHS